MEAYCIKCHKKVQMKDVKEIRMKNGRPACVGKCKECGTKVYRVGKKPKK